LAGVILFYVGLKEQRKALQLNETALLKQIEALNVQKEEMQLLRKEYVAARDVFTQQKEALKAQASTAKVQQFESNFYSLINIYTNITREFFGESGDLKQITDDLKIIPNVEDKKFEERIKLVEEHYISIYQKHKDKISHYLKTVYRIYKTIDEESLFTEKQRFFYSKIIRSQFTEEELFIIYYNSISKYGTNFRTLILKYNLLKHLSFLSKIEMSDLLTDNESFNYRRECFCEELEQHLMKATKLISDLEIENPQYSTSIEIIDTVVILESQLDEDNYLTLLVSGENNNHLLHLGMENNDEFIELVKYSVLDRLFNNNFEFMDTGDLVKVSILDKSIFELKIITENKLQLNEDRF